VGFFAAGARSTAGSGTLTGSSFFCGTNSTVSTFSFGCGVRKPGSTEIAKACTNNEIKSAHRTLRSRCHGSGDRSKKNALSAAAVVIKLISNYVSRVILHTSNNLMKIMSRIC
jgi:hypothetical protein